MFNLSSVTDRENLHTGFKNCRQQHTFYTLFSTHEAGEGREGGVERGGIEQRG